MAMTRQSKMVCAGLGFLVLSAVLISGCSTLAPNTDASPDGQDKRDRGPSPLYYDFGDVLVPSELKLLNESTFVFRTPGMSAGVLSFRGRVEISSLIAFFENNMIKDNWKPVSSFKSKRTFMLYRKENRWCVISIAEGDFSTSAEIWVAPTMGETEGGLLK